MNLLHSIFPGFYNAVVRIKKATSELSDAVSGFRAANCDRCGTLFKVKHQEDKQNGMPTPVAFKCRSCGNIYCTKCAKCHQSYGGVTDYALTCKCESPHDFDKIPAKYGD